jgi:tetratricopeptide (TPR) repeat protein
MWSRRSLGFGVFLLAIAATEGAQASEFDHAPRLKTSLIPRKVSSARDRASEVVQRTADLVLWDGDKKVVPSGAGHRFIVEKTEQNRWLVSDMNEGLRGWVMAGTMCPLADAASYFSEQIRANPTSAFALLMRGVARSENDDLEQAASDLDLALKIDPKYVPALIERAYLRRWQGRLADAIADVTKAIELDAHHSYAYVERGVFEYTNREYDKALRDFQSAIDKGSQAAVIFIGRGLIFLIRSDLKRAGTELATALKVDPRHPDAYGAIAQMFMIQGRPEKALETMNQAVEIDPLCAESHGNRAVVYLAMGAFDKALDDLDEVLRVAPDSARALRERAWIIATCTDAKVRDGEQAVTSAARACELTGWDDMPCLITLAAACAEAGDFAGAVKWQQKVVQSLPAQSPLKHEYERVLDRYKAKKPYHRLTLVRELGLPYPHPAPKKTD